MSANQYCPSFEQITDQSSKALETLLAIRLIVLGLLKAISRFAAITHSIGLVWADLLKDSVKMQAYGLESSERCFSGYG